MQNLQAKSRKVKIICQGEEISFTLRPFTFGRLVEISALFNRQIEDILLNPTPIEISKLAYCLMDEKDREVINSIKMKNGEETLETDAMSNLYLIMSEDSVTDGFYNLSQITTAINKLIHDCMTVDNKKKNLNALEGRQSDTLEPEEIYDIIASEYGCYTYDYFMENITPKQAFRFIDIIQVRQHNNYCDMMSLHGHNANKYRIKRKKESSGKDYYRPTPEEYEAMEKQALKVINGGKDGK